MLNVLFRSLTVAFVLLVQPAIASEETTAIRAEMVAKGADKDIALKLNNAYDTYLMADFCQRTGSTSKDDLAQVAKVAKTYEASINLPELHQKLWEASSKAVNMLSITALDTDQSYGMCLDVRDLVDKTILQLKEPEAKPF